MPDTDISTPAKTLKLGSFEADDLRLLVRLADLDLPRRLVVDCAWSGKFYVGDLIQMSWRGVCDLGFAPGTKVERWTADRAALMEGIVFGFAEPRPEIFAFGMDRLDLGTRAANCVRDETVGAIAEMTRDEFMRIPGAGRDTRHEVREALARVGVAFSGEIAAASRVDQALVRRLLGSPG